MPSLLRKALGRRQQSLFSLDHQSSQRPTINMVIRKLEVESM